jgi:hypothetical protein
MNFLQIGREVGDDPQAPDTEPMDTPVRSLVIDRHLHRESRRHRVVDEVSYARSSAGGRNDGTRRRSDRKLLASKRVTGSILTGRKPQVASVPTRGETRLTPVTRRITPL